MCNVERLSYRQMMIARATIRASRPLADTPTAMPTTFPFDVCVSSRYTPSVTDVFCSVVPVFGSVVPALVAESVVVSVFLEVGVVLPLYQSIFVYENSRSPQYFAEAIGMTFDAYNNNKIKHH